MPHSDKAVQGVGQEVGKGGGEQAAAGDVRHVTAAGSIQSLRSCLSNHRQEVGKGSSLRGGRLTEPPGELLGAVQVGGGRAGQAVEELDDGISGSFQHLADLVRRGLQRV